MLSKSTSSPKAEYRKKSSAPKKDRHKTPGSKYHSRNYSDPKKLKADLANSKNLSYNKQLKNTKNSQSHPILPRIKSARSKDQNIYKQRQPKNTSPKSYRNYNLETKYDEMLSQKNNKNQFQNLSTDQTKRNRQQTTKGETFKLEPM